MNFLYSLATSILVLALCPVIILYRMITGSKRQGLAHQFGLVPVAPKAKTDKEKTVWVHALSRGEVKAAQPVLKRLGEIQPAWNIVVSVTTESGFQAAIKDLPEAQSVFYHPLDAWPCLTLALNRIQPNLFVLAETGYWPGFLSALSRRGIPACVFNLRISKRSIERYSKVSRFLNPPQRFFNLLCLRSEESKADLDMLGVSKDRMQVVGDTKFDALQVRDSKPPDHPLFKIPEGVKVFVAGSTHRGEEEILIEAFKNLQNYRYPLLMILAPRRIERVEEIENLLKAHSVSYVRRSGLDGDSLVKESFVLFDSMGELMQAYAMSDLTFVGNSLVSPGGGHNLLEPASLGKPVLHGPYMEHHQFLAQSLDEESAGFEVKDSTSIEKTWIRLMEDQDLYQTVSQKALNFVETNRGASISVAQLISKCSGI